MKTMAFVLMVLVCLTVRMEIPVVWADVPQTLTNAGIVTGQNDAAVAWQQFSTWFVKTVWTPMVAYLLTPPPVERAWDYCAQASTPYPCPK